MKTERPAFLDHFVFTKKISFMQRVADLVRTGHHLYVHGVIDINKAGFFAAKLDRKFNVSATKLQASRMRKLGESTARLFLLQLDIERPELIWILLYQPGVNPDMSERWLDATKQRVSLTGYELLRLTKAGESNPVWTWQYSRERHTELRNHVVSLIRQNRDRELQELILTIWRSPGFAGIRRQVKKFSELIEGEWKRSRSGSEHKPEVPAQIGYVRRRADFGVRLSCLRKARTIEKALTKDIESRAEVDRQRKPPICAPSETATVVLEVDSSKIEATS